VPRDAEAWLAERGVQREPVVLRDRVDAPPPTPGEVVDLARQVARDRALTTGPRPSPEPPAATEPEAASAAPPTGGVAGAIAFLERSTANAPQSEGRLRGKLRDRGYTDEEAEAALAAARARGLVDDDALLAALISERRARGHAEPRLRRDLRDRGFDGAVVDAALAQHRDTDPLAAAFGLARDQAVRQRTAPPEAAVRRITAYLVRRGHGEAVARKAALDAVHADRDPLRSAER
jgi:regulatory protein